MSVINNNNEDWSCKKCEPGTRTQHFLQQWPEHYIFVNKRILKLDLAEGTN